MGYNFVVFLILLIGVLGSCMGHERIIWREVCDILLIKHKDDKGV